MRPVAIATRVCPHCNFQWSELAGQGKKELPQEKEGQLVKICDLKKDEKQDIIRIIAREAANLKQAISIGKKHGIEHKSIYGIWTKQLKLSRDAVRRLTNQ